MAEKLVLSTVRLSEGQFDRIDRLVEKLGGNRSDFIRLAVSERIDRLEKLLSDQDLEQPEVVG